MNEQRGVSDLQEFVERVAALSNPEHYGNARDLLSQIIREANELLEPAQLVSDDWRSESILDRCSKCGSRVYSSLGFCGFCHPERC